MIREYKLTLVVSALSVPDIEHIVSWLQTNTIHARIDSSRELYALEVDVELEHSDKAPRQPGCLCDREEGDSPCPELARRDRKIDRLRAKAAELIAELERLSEQATRRSIRGPEAEYWYEREQTLNEVSALIVEKFNVNR